MLALLDELTSRACADQVADEAAWLAVRRGGVTASDMAKLARGGAGTRDRLLAEKREGSAFKGNADTQWGKDREQAFAGTLRQFGIEPEWRVFHAVDNPRFLASPDGVGINPKTGGLQLAEVKTSKYKLNLNSAKFAATGYMFQMQWQMYVTGAEQVLLLWERHDGDTVFPVQLAIIPRDPKIIASLVEQATEFLALLDGERVVSETDTTTIGVLARQLATLREQSAQVEAALRAAIGGRKFSGEFDGVSVSYTGDKLAPKRSVDTSRAQAEHPEAWQRLQDATVAWDVMLEEYTTTRMVEQTGRLTVKAANPA